MEEVENVIIERIINRQEKANERILRELGKIIGEIGELTPSEAYTIAQQLKYGESLNKIIKILSSTSELTEKEIFKMLEKEARHNLALKKIFFQAKEIDYIPYEQNAPLQNLVREVALATVGTYRNISMTTGLTYLDTNGNRITKGIREAYYEIVDNAILNVNMGKESFWQAMKNQLQTIGNAGVQSIEYESGYHRRIDSALRMNLLDGLNELAQRQQELIGVQFESDGVEISVHENPAPDHADIQGHIFTNEQFNRMQSNLDFEDINGRKYAGIERIIGQWNCYHEAFSIVIGISKPRYTQKELDKINANNKKGFDFEGKHYTNYEGTQLQRRIEVEIRRVQETNIIAKASGQQELIDKSQIRMDNLVHKYYQLSKASKLPTKLQRIRTLTKT